MAPVLVFMVSYIDVYKNLLHKNCPTWNSIFCICLCAPVDLSSLLSHYSSNSESALLLQHCSKRTNVI